MFVTRYTRCSWLWFVCQNIRIVFIFVQQIPRPNINYRTLTTCQTLDESLTKASRHLSQINSTSLIPSTTNPDFQHQTGLKVWLQVSKLLLPIIQRGVYRGVLWTPVCLQTLSNIDSMSNVQMTFWTSLVQLLCDTVAQIGSALWTLDRLHCRNELVGKPSDLQMNPLFILSKQNTRLVR